MSQNIINSWKSGKIIKGKGIGKTLGYPTINLDNPQIMGNSQKGVYLSKIIIESKEYWGLLYFGPRLVLGETINILEIYIIDFMDETYGKTIKFKLIKYLRGVMEFENLSELKAQIKNDFALGFNLIK